MTDLILGHHFDIGSRQVYEDRSAIDVFTTAGGLKLTVAMVADGVGGENKGERAAQLTIDTMLNYLRGSQAVNVPRLLFEAIRATNRVVVDEVRRVGDARIACTVAIAAMLNGNRLYIANVGDSRVYLVRKRQLTQLTRDHTNERGALVRAIGIMDDLPVDIGFHVGGVDERTALDRGQQGLELQKGDSVLVCTDGLIKPSRDGVPFTTDQEIIDVLNRKEGENAARTLVAYALGRNANDNVTVALIQTPDPSRTRRQRLVWTAIVAAIVTLAVLLVVVVLNLFQTREELAENVQQQTGTAIAVASITATPSPMPSWTPIPQPTFTTDEIGFWYGLTSRIQRNFRLREPVVAQNEPFFLAVTDRIGSGANGNLYLQMGSSLRFTSLGEDQMHVDLSSGSGIFVQTGGYTRGAAITLEQDPNIQFTVSGSCMAVSYPDPQDLTLVVASCYEGNCWYATRRGGSEAPIPVGQQVTIDVDTKNILGPRNIPHEEADNYHALLALTAFGQDDIVACRLERFMTPTATPTPRSVTVPTAQPTSTITPTVYVAGFAVN